AGYPNYPAPDADGYPAKVDVSRRLAMFFADYPDYYETFRPKLDKTFNPAVQNEKKEYAANEEYKDVPGAVLRVGNLPRSASDGVHSADDAVLTAIGPGSEMVHGFMDNTEVCQVMVNALGPSRSRRCVVGVSLRSPGSGSHCRVCARPGLAKRCGSRRCTRPPACSVWRCPTS